MNATWVKKLAFSALGCAMASGTFAMANSIPVSVDFSCSDGQGVKSAGGNLCSGGSGRSELRPSQSGHRDSRWFRYRNHQRSHFLNEFLWLRLDRGKGQSGIRSGIDWGNEHPDVSESELAISSRSRESISA